MARARRAEAQQRIQETMSGMSDKSAFESFERMTEKIEDNERKAIASAELQEEFSGDSLAQQFEALEYHGSADQQLLELKAKMGLLGAGGSKETRQIGKGADDVHDAEVLEIEKDDDDAALSARTSRTGARGVAGELPLPRPSCASVPLPILQPGCERRLR